MSYTVLKYEKKKSETWTSDCIIDYRPLEYFYNILMVSIINKFKKKKITTFSFQNKMAVDILFYDFIRVLGIFNLLLGCKV